jgi:ActD protein
MSKRLLIGTFEHEDDILNATKAVRKDGYRIVDVYAPYAVHGLDRAMGLRPSRLPWVCFLLGLLGAGAKVWFEFWTTASDWPVNVGGKPWNSLPAFIPITFEVMVLFAGLSTVFAFFLVSRLRPGRKAKLIVEGVTNDRFALVLEQVDAAFSVDAVCALLERYNVISVEEQLEEVESS